MPSYRPACSVDLTLRFDETLHVVDDPPLKSVEDLLGAGLNLEPPNLPGLPGLPKLGPGAPATTPPLIMETGDKNASFVSSRVPKAATVALPGYRQAGTFSLTFDFRQLPIDPRVIRSAAVQVHFGTVSDKQQADGVDKPGGFRLKTSADTLALMGLVDEWHVEHGESSSEVTISGRDLRGILLDTPISPDPAGTSTVLGELDLSQPIDKVVKQLLGFNPFFESFVVAVNPAEWVDGRVGVPGSQASAPAVRRGAKGKRKSARATPPGTGNARTSFWDMIVRLSYLVGAIPFFRGPELHIRPAASIYAQRGVSENPLQPTPFKGGRPRKKDAQSGEDIEALRVRRLVYGRDVKVLSFDRKLGGFQKPGTVRVTSVDPSQRGLEDSLVSARWPPKSAEKARQQSVAASNKAAREDFIEVPVSATLDHDQLEQIARSIYEEVGRGEIGGHCDSGGLASFGGDNDDPDIVKLRPGDGVEFVVDKRALKSTSPLVSALTDSQRTSFDEQVQEVKRQLNGDENLARVVVATARGKVAELQRFFRVSNVDFAWSHESGLQVGFDFQNFVEVRAAVEAVKAPGGTARRSKVGQ